MREKAALAVPRNSSRRRRVANARIDSILYALIQEGLRGGGPEGGWYRSGGEEEGVGGGEEAAAEDGKPSTKRDGSIDTAWHLLGNDDVEAVVTYVDKDQSGEIDVEVGGLVGWFGWAKATKWAPMYLPCPDGYNAVRIAGTNPPPFGYTVVRPE